MVGQTIGKYRVIDRIGRGGMGTVYRATDETLHRDVAIKVLNAGLNDPEIARRFRAEAITVARLSHPGIATVYELFEHDGQWLMVMEFVRGETLDALVSRSGPVSAERAAEICLHALNALAHAHGQGIVHRDLKPSNLMLTEAGTVKVMDFGIARVRGAEHLTHDGFMMGTPAYMAPEQVLGHETDPRADLYSIGVVFYRLVTGALPFTGGSPFAMAQSQVNDRPTSIATFRPNLPAWVDQVVERALAKSPDDRFQSASSFHDALASGLSGRDPSAPFDPSGRTAMLVTPPLAVRTGSLKPLSTTDPAVPDGTAPMMLPAALALPGGASVPAVRPNLVTFVNVAAGLVVVILGAGIWRSATAYYAPPPEPPRAGAPPPGDPVPSAPTAAPVTNAASAPPAVVTAPPPPPQNVLATASTGASRRGSAKPVEHVFSKGLKAIVMAGDKAEDPDVVLSLMGERVSVAPKDGSKIVQSLPYGAILRATHVYAHDPVFDPSLFAPPSGTDFPGLIAHNWLTLQNRSTFIALRVDTNITGVIAAIEAATGLKVVRAPASK